MQALEGISLASLIIYVLFFNRGALYLFGILLFIYLIIRWIFTPSSASKFTTIRRLISISTWSDPTGPELYTNVYVKADKLQQYLDQHKDIKIWALVLKAISLCLQQYPEVNGRICFGKYIKNKRNELSFLMAKPDQFGLIQIRDAYCKTPLDITTEVLEKLNNQKAGKDKAFNKIMSFSKILPDFILNPLLSLLIGYCSQSFDMSILGIPQRVFGSGIVCEMDLDNAFLPIPSFARTSFICSVCQINKKVEVDEKDNVVAQDYLTVGFTGDHRYLDGIQASNFTKAMEAYLEDPQKLMK